MTIFQRLLLSPVKKNEENSSISGDLFKIDEQNRNYWAAAVGVFNFIWNFDADTANIFLRKSIKTLEFIEASVQDTERKKSMELAVLAENLYRIENNYNIKRKINENTTIGKQLLALKSKETEIFDQVNKLNRKKLLLLNIPLCKTQVIVSL